MTPSTLPNPQEPSASAAASVPAAPRRAGPGLYALVVVLPVLVILLALRLGSGLPPTSGGTGALAPRVVSGEPSPAGFPAATDAGTGFGLLLAQILVVLIATRLCGMALRPLGQPHVVGEMLAGILLGPSLFGLMAPEAAAFLFPRSSLGVLSALSQVGMVLYMFLVGTELDVAGLRERGRAAVLTSHASIAVPFAMGVTLALALYGPYGPPGVAFAPFALFLGAALSVTAFPVLARILAERGLLRTPLGALAMSAAAVDDVTAWTILAAITVFVRTAGAESIPWGSLVGVVVFIGATAALRRSLRRLVSGAFARAGGLTHGQIAGLVGLALAGAGITEALGVHALFGAFFMGLLLSRERPVVEALRARIEAPLVVVLLPLYFAFTGLRTELHRLAAPDLLGVAVAVVAVAVLGKLGASALAARASGVPTRDALALGTLMNTRGLMELVILNIGLDLGVLPPALFSIMVLMAFATTLMTSPLLSALRVGTGSLQDRALADRISP